MARYLLAIDQGTTGSTALVMGTDGRTVGRSTVELPQHFPEPAWVEHDPHEIIETVRGAVEGALRAASIRGAEIAAIGITNQRETTLVWERASGRPIDRAIVWQDRRTTDECERLKARGLEADVKERTGLVLDPYFSATKIAWLLDRHGARARAERGELCFGTVDSYLLWRLAGSSLAGRPAPHVIEVSNASRTSLMNLATLAWDDHLCASFRVPTQLLPKIVPSTGQIAHTAGFAPLPDGIPITGVAGDQQAALFGQACFEPGDAKCTYGTGAFLVVNTGLERVRSQHGLLATVAWQIGGNTVYALEGSCFVAGAAVQWLRDGLRLIRSAKEVEALARTVESSEGVVFVPALSGLGAPHWDPGARGLIAGLTRGSNAGHIARATLEAIAFQVADLVDAIRDDLEPGATEPDTLPSMSKPPGTSARDASSTPRGESSAPTGRISAEGLRLTRIRVDGGAAENNLLMQFQSDVSDLCIERPLELESTARGAAMLAGVGAGIFEDVSQAARMVNHPERFVPQMTRSMREQHMSTWRAALDRARSSRSETSGAPQPPSAHPARLERHGN